MINPFEVANVPNLPLSERIHAQFHNTGMCNSATFPIERFFRIFRMLLVMDLIICAVQIAQSSLKMVNHLKNIGIVYQL